MWLADDRTGGKIIVNNRNKINKGKINKCKNCIFAHSMLYFSKCIWN